MNPRTTGAGLAAVLMAGLVLTACGDVEDGGGNGGYARGWQPGSYFPAPVHQVEGVDSGIRASLARKAALDALPEDGWHGRLRLLDLSERVEPITNRYQHHLE